MLVLIPSCPSLSGTAHSSIPTSGVVPGSRCGSWDDVGSDVVEARDVSIFRISPRSVVHKPHADLLPSLMAGGLSNTVNPTARGNGTEPRFEERFCGRDPEGMPPLPAEAFASKPLAKTVVRSGMVDPAGVCPGDSYVQGLGRILFKEHRAVRVHRTAALCHTCPGCILSAGGLRCTWHSDRMCE